MLGIAMMLSSTSGAAENSSKNDFSLLIGYQGVELDGTSVRREAYDWNPSGNMPGLSSIPGPKRSTSLDGGITSFAAVGVRYEREISRGWKGNLDLGGLIAPAHRDEHPTTTQLYRMFYSHRPTPSVYSESRYGAFGSVGLTYNLTDRVYVGADVRVTAVIIESGWVWRGKDYRTSTDVPIFVSGGPKLGVKLMDHLNVETHVHFGKTFGCGLSLVVPFSK